MTLWQFTRSIARRQVVEVEDFTHRWNFGIVSLEERSKATHTLLAAGHGYVMTGHSLDPVSAHSIEGIEAIEEQIVKDRLFRKAQIDLLLTEALPAKVRRALTSGKYEVTARRIVDQKVITLGPRDLAVLTADYTKNQFTGSAGAYGEVAICKKPGAPAASRRRPPQKKLDAAFDRYKTATTRQPSAIGFFEYCRAHASEPKPSRQQVDDYFKDVVGKNPVGRPASRQLVISPENIRR
jgi:hypothetical protein